MTRTSERGVALVVALFLMSVLSVLAASLMFLSQTETYSSLNYRMMSQSRYAAEAAVQKVGNFLLDTGQYTAPSPYSSTDPYSAYDTTKSPVQYGGQAVVLSSNPDVPSNYPSTALTPGSVPVATAFSTATQGTLTATGNATLNYKAYATLMAMQKFQTYGGTEAVVQTWEVTADGGISGSRPATVEVVATVETPKVPANSYGAFATDPNCGALTFGGNVTINSYDSTGMTGSTSPTMSTTGGDVGTNGNLSISGSVEVQGNLYTPRTGVGSCEDGAVTALTDSGVATVTGSTVQLPQAANYLTPAIPAYSTTPDVHLSSSGTTATTCLALGFTNPLDYGASQADVTSGTAKCYVDSGTNTITINGHGSTLSLPTVDMSSHVNLLMVAGDPPAQYDFNSIALSGGASVGVYATSPSQEAVVNVVGQDSTGTAIATPIDFSGGTYTAVTGCATCSAYDASMLQILYGGTGDIELTGNAGAAVTVYAPNATVDYSGTSDLYGSVLAKTIDESGSGNIHYDRRLQHDFWVPGSPLMTTFSWKRAN
jgi:Tfp pilus assembly protein PilX